MTTINGLSVCVVAYWGLTLPTNVGRCWPLHPFIMWDRAYNYRFGLSMYWASWLSNLHMQGGQELDWAVEVGVGVFGLFYFLYKFYINYFSTFSTFLHFLGVFLLPPFFGFVGVCILCVCVLCMCMYMWCHNYNEQPFKGIVVCRYIWASLQPSISCVWTNGFLVCGD